MLAKLCLSFCLCFRAVGLAASPPDDAQMEAVKHWLSVSPCFSLIRYSAMDYQDRKERGYALAVCGETFVFKQSNTDYDFSVPISRTNRNRATLFLGRLGSMRWQIASGGYKVTESYSPDPARPDPYAAASDSTLMTIAEPLTFGSMQLQPGSFVWKGNTFAAKLNPVAEQIMRGAGRNDTNWLHRLLMGKIERTSPTNLVLSGPLLGRAELTFAQNAGLPLGWPKRIEVLRDNKRVRQLVFQVVETGTPADVREIANPANLITAEVAQRSVWSNGVEIATAEANNLVVSLVREELAEQMRNREPGLQRKPMYFLLAGLVGIVALGWLAFRRTKTEAESKP